MQFLSTVPFDRPSSPSKGASPACNSHNEPDIALLQQLLRPLHHKRLIALHIHLWGGDREERRIRLDLEPDLQRSTSTGVPTSGPSATIDKYSHCC